MTQTPQKLLGEFYCNFAEIRHEKKHGQFLENFPFTHSSLYFSLYFSHCQQYYLISAQLVAHRKTRNWRKTQ